jgi:hypothetical protein
MQKLKLERSQLAVGFIEPQKLLGLSMRHRPRGDPAGTGGSEASAVGCCLGGVEHDVSEERVVEKSADGVNLQCNVGFPTLPDIPRDIDTM